MNTNFFNQIAQLDITGNLQLTISKGEDNNLVVSVFLNNEQCGDKAKKQITPFILRETAEKLDEEFFETIANPMEKTSSLLVEMEIYLKRLEEAKKQSAMEKEKTDKEKKEKEAKTKKYTEAMANVDELEKEGKHREAWIKVPQVNDYPEKADEIRKRKAELSAKFAPDLFGQEETVQKEKPKSEDEGLYPTYPTDYEIEDTEFDNEEEY